MFAPWTQTEEPEPQKPSNNSVADQIKKVGDRNRNLSNELKKHGYDQKQFEQDDQHFQKVYDEWKQLLRFIPGLSRGSHESQMIAGNYTSKNSSRPSGAEIDAKNMTYSEEMKTWVPNIPKTPKV